jgi:hypothetical protein
MDIGAEKRINIYEYWKKIYTNMESVREEMFITRKDTADFKILATRQLNLRSQ